MIKSIENKKEEWMKMMSYPLQHFYELIKSLRKRQTRLAASKSHRFARTLFRLMPFFILHLSSGLSGSFTTILIEHFRQLHKEDSSNLSAYETLLGSFEDYGPIFVAILGGFLQQLFGPKKILIAAGIPSFLSWVLVAIAPNSFYFLLSSRLLAGLSNGLLTGNVYMAEVAPSEYITSFKSIEAASRSMGAILIFAIAMKFYKFGFRYVAIVASIFPLLGLVGTVFSRESPIFEQRVKDIILCVESQESEVESANSFSTRWIQAKKKLKFPLRSPTVYQPMILIVFALLVQHFSGFTFTKKFLLQVLKSPNIQETQNSSSLNGTNPIRLKREADAHSIDQRAYMFAIIINFIRFISNMMMARFLRTFRVRFLYFISLFSTSICLIILGFLVEGKIFSQYFSPEVDQYLKVTILGVHVFCVQFGLQTLSGQMTDILLPSSSKAILKGFIRALQALSLMVFVTIVKQFPDYWSFWSMAIVLVCVSPFLYIVIPEIKNLGKASSEYLFRPSQTIFYVLPFNGAKKRWLDAFRKVQTESILTEDVKQNPLIEANNKNTKTTFFPDTLELIKNDEGLKKVNRDRVCFITNILSQTGFLNRNDDKSRICIGSGPITFLNGLITNGGIFLFGDLVIVARKLVKNRRYINEKVFEFKDNFEVRTDGASLYLISDRISKVVQIELETVYQAALWEKYLNFCVKNLDHD